MVFFLPGATTYWCGIRGGIRAQTSIVIHDRVSSPAKYVAGDREMPQTPGKLSTGWPVRSVGETPPRLCTYRVTHQFRRIL